MAHLILVRHGESTWNAQGLWTGLTDVPLSEKGVEEAKTAAIKLKDIKIDIAFVSTLSRALQTWQEVEKTLSLPFLPFFQDKALNEKDYGEYTGKNKWDIKEQVGEEEFRKIRRSWNHPIPGGETLKNVYERVVPYYTHSILPELKQGKNVIVVAHGNSLRALAKYLENIPDDQIASLEIPTGQVLVYEIDQNGSVSKKELR